MLLQDRPASRSWASGLGVRVCSLKGGQLMMQRSRIGALSLILEVVFGVGLGLGMLWLPAGCSSSGSGSTDAAVKDAAVKMVCLDGAVPGSIGAGETCGCNADCGSGFCANGVCCNVACSGTCQACDLPGLKGTCSPVPAGAAPRVAGQCLASKDAGSCLQNGKCDGQGGCQNQLLGTMCNTTAQSAVCSADGLRLINLLICDGAGSCRPGPDLDCAPYACTNNQCRSTCASNPDCNPATTCVKGSCGPVPNGRGPCTLATAAYDCQSGFCADGVCCNVACSGQCVSCNQPGSLGRCQAVGPGLPHPQCKMQPEASCGMTGVCDDSAHCAYYPLETKCGTPSSCAGTMLNPAGTCDGAGACQASRPVECAPFMCSVDACRSDCKTDADCVPTPDIPHPTCNGGSCGMKRNGSFCKLGAEL